MSFDTEYSKVFEVSLKRSSELSHLRFERDKLIDEAQQILKKAITL